MSLRDHPFALIADAYALLAQERTELACKALLGGLTRGEAGYLCALERFLARVQRWPPWGAGGPGAHFG